MDSFVVGPHRRNETPSISGISPGRFLDGIDLVIANDKANEIIGLEFSPTSRQSPAGLQLRSRKVIHNFIVASCNNHGEILRLIEIQDHRRVQMGSQRAAFHWPAIIHRPMTRPYAETVESYNSIS